MPGEWRRTVSMASGKTPRLLREPSTLSSLRVNEMSGMEAAFTDSPTMTIVPDAATARTACSSTAGDSGSLEDAGGAVVVRPVGDGAFHICCAGIDDDLGTERRGQLESGEQRIDDQHPRAALSGDDQDGLPDGTGAEDDDLVTRRQPRATDGVLGDRQRLTEDRDVWGQVAGRVQVGRRQRDALTQAAVYLDPDGLHAGAAVALAAPAGEARPARDDGLDRDTLAEGESTDALSKRLDDAHELVALGAGVVHVGVVAQVEVQVRSAQPDDLDADDGLAGSRDRVGILVDLGLPRPHRHDATHLLLRSCPATGAPSGRWESPLRPSCIRLRRAAERPCRAADSRHAGDGIGARTTGRVTPSGGMRPSPARVCSEHGE